MFLFKKGCDILGNDFLFWLGDIILKKRLVQTMAVLLFMLVLVVAVVRTPHTRSTVPAVVEIEEADRDSGKVDYLAMSEKELLVLAYDGDAEACYRLGVMYDYGAGGVQQNFTSALEWYRTADAYGQTQAAAGIGYLYLNGCGVDKDTEAARQYFARSVALGDPQGYVGLGRVGLDTGGDEPEIFSNIKTAKDAGLLDGTYYLGYLYEKGIGTKRRAKKAYRLYQKTAESDSEAIEDQYAIHAARTRLGILYMEGIGVDADRSAAREQFETAADDGYAMAQYYLGIMYEMGYGMPIDYARALDYFELAAQQDYAPALNEIGCMYFNGHGVETNFEQAVYYQKLAAALGYEKAQVNLGYLYENGYGVEQNLQTALTYYQMAKETGYAGADEAEARVRARLENEE